MSLDTASDHTGGDWLRGKSSHTAEDNVCLICGENCSRVALVELVYTFDVCDCGRWRYAHLVERLSHRNHYSVKLEADSE